RVRAAALPDAQPAPGAVEGPDPRPGVELRLRRSGQRRRAVHLLPAQEDRRRPGADDPHGAGRRIRAQARPALTDNGRMSVRGWWARRTLAARLGVTSIALMAVVSIVIGLVSVAALEV